MSKEWGKVIYSEIYFIGIMNTLYGLSSNFFLRCLSWLLNIHETNNNSLQKRRVCLAIGSRFVTCDLFPAILLTGMLIESRLREGEKNNNNEQFSCFLYLS